MDYFERSPMNSGGYITPDELLTRYRDGERNFAGISLDSRNGSSRIIADADLREINLSGADLTEFRLERINLSEATLIGANFFYSVLIDVNLSHADLRSLNFRRCQGFNVDLSLAFMTKSKWLETKFIKPNLFYTNLEESVFICSSLKDAINTEPFRIWGSFVWHLTLPDGSLYEKERFVDYP